MDKLLQFVYSGSYSTHDLDDDVLVLSFHAAMVGLGDQYNISGLFEYAVKKLHEEMFDMDKRSGSRYSMADVLRQLPFIYDILPDTNRTLRKPLVNAIVRECFILRTSKRDVKDIRDLASKELEKAAETHSQFAVDMVNAFNKLDPSTYLFSRDSDDGLIHCATCTSNFGANIEEQLHEELYWNWDPQKINQQRTFFFTCDGCLEDEIVADWQEYKNRCGDNGRASDDPRAFFYLPKASTDIDQENDALVS